MPQAIQSGVRSQASRTEFQRSFFSSMPRLPEPLFSSKMRYEARGTSGTKLMWKNLVRTLNKPATRSTCPKSLVPNTPIRSP